KSCEWRLPAGRLYHAGRRRRSHTRCCRTYRNPRIAIDRDRRSGCGDCVSRSRRVFTRRADVRTTRDLSLATTALTKILKANQRVSQVGNFVTAIELLFLSVLHSSVVRSFVDSVVKARRVCLQQQLSAVGHPVSR